MSTRKIATALGAAVLLIGAPASYALAGQEDPGRPDKPGGVHECEDGVDNDGDGSVDAGADADCESPRDNSEGPDEAETPGGPGTVIGPVNEVLGTVRDTLFPEEEPPAEEPGEEEPPAEEPPAEDPLPPLPAPDPAALEQLITDTVATVEAAVADVVGQLPPPPGQ